MENNIASILKTDRKARERLERTRETALKKKLELDGEIEKFRVKSQQKAEKAIEEIRSDEERKIKAAADETERYAKKTRKELENRYEENCSKWVSEIVKRSLS